MKSGAGAVYDDTMILVPTVAQQRHHVTTPTPHAGHGAEASWLLAQGVAGVPVPVWRILALLSCVRLAGGGW